MNLILFIVMIIASIVVVRIGAIAFQLTGLEWSLAKFQSLSCFTGTGYTTKEAELIVGHPQRRRIASTLMILGNAGFVTLIATFANSLRPRAVAYKISIPFLHLDIPSQALPWINLAIIVIVTFILFKLFAYSPFARKLTSFLKKRIVKADVIKSVSFEELIVATEGYVVSKIDICEKSPVLNKTLKDTKLRSLDITVLAVEREGHTIPNPPSDTSFMLGDKVICFGKLETIKKEICVTP
ncbi:MAG: TrkA C-terminal domain-containing protein [Candidatus Omnitrophota bacterium]